MALSGYTNPTSQEFISIIYHLYFESISLSILLDSYCMTFVLEKVRNHLHAIKGLLIQSRSWMCQQKMNCSGWQEWLAKGLRTEAILWPHAVAWVGRDPKCQPYRSQPVPSLFGATLAQWFGDHLHWCQSNLLRSVTVIAAVTVVVAPDVVLGEGQIPETTMRSIFLQGELFLWVSMRLNKYERQ